MRSLAMIIVAFLTSGCGMVNSLTKKDDLPKPAKTIEQSKVDDTFRGILHSNDPANDGY